MKDNRLIFIIFLLVILILVSINHKEDFTDFSQVFGRASDDSLIKKDELLKTTGEILNKGNIPITNNSVDDKMISEFIQKQLGKEDAPSKDSYDTTMDLLPYPDDKPKSDDVPPVKLNYESLLNQQNKQIQTLTNRQNLTLRNIKYELLRLKQLQKSIPKMESDIRAKKELEKKM